MSKLFDLLKPAPFIEEIKDKEEVKGLYKYWRIRILYSMFFGYVFYYFSRKSLVFAAAGMFKDSELGFDKSHLGLLVSILAITYGISKFGSGLLSDKSNPRYFMAIGLILTGILNILFGFSSSLFAFAIFWGLNGWFQGFGWPPCTRLLTYWYSHSERGSWWSTCSVSHNVGSFLIPWIAGYCVQHFGWRYAMFIPGIFCILGGLFLLNRLRDTPQSLGLPAIEKHRNDYAGWTKEDDTEETPSTKKLLVDYVLKNPYIWLLSFAYFFLYIVRLGINDWTMIYLAEEKDYTPFAAAGITSLFEGGGFAGSLVAGWASDRLFGARRGPVNLLFAVGVLASVIFMWYVPKGNPMLDTIAMASMGFFIFGPQMLIGVAVVELANKKAAATSNGFAGWFAYMGSAIAGYPLGIITQDWGWDGYFWFMVICSVITIAFLVPLWSIDCHTKTEPVPKPA